MPPLVLALNTGSSSIKFGLFDISGAEPAQRFAGQIDVAGKLRLVVKNDAGAVVVDRSLEGPAQPERLLDEILQWTRETAGEDGLAAVGHRIVHGGSQFTQPVRLDREVIDELVRLTPLAPLHQQAGLAPARRLLELKPDLTQIGCFDTAFHAGLVPPASRFALPLHFEAEGIRRYGFHGLSYEFIAARLRRVAPAMAEKRVVVAHLGGGASLCAMRDGCSVDTTMGFTPLDGVMMGTRCGTIDPGILLFLLRQRGMPAQQLEHLLYSESGLLGVSGIAGDVRKLLASRDPHAAEAIDLFTFEVAKAVCAMAVTLHGLDGLVFTGGIGEHAAKIRAMICQRLDWLGIALDTDANDAAADIVSSRSSAVEVRVMPTSEETTIARQVRALMG